MIASAIAEQIIQLLSEKLWQRPEFAPLRTPIEGALSADRFKTLTQTAFNTAYTEIPCRMGAILRLGLLRYDKAVGHIFGDG